MAVLALASISSAQKGVEKPAQQPTLNADTVAGCFSSLADMKLNATYKFNAQSWCVTQCRKMGKLVGATYSQNCYCGTLLPNNKTLLDDSKCNEPCPGYDTEACMFGTISVLF
jgi:cell wall integrity and stress response component